MSSVVSPSIVLIGMPGAGKSTLGVILAKRLAKDFVDTDLLIQLRAGAALQDIISKQGYQALRKMEEQVLLETEFANHVIATGGSAVYSNAAMEHLKKLGPVVFLKVDLAEIEKRIGDYSMRGIAAAPGLTFEDVFNERNPLYQRYADIVIDEHGKNAEEIVDEIVTSL